MPVKEAYVIENGLRRSSSGKRASCLTLCLDDGMIGSVLCKEVAYMLLSKYGA